MRFISKLTMTVAAIFFAGSVSADVRDSDGVGGTHLMCTKSQALGKKAYQVCKSWRDDQGGPMPESEMQYCWDTLCAEAEKETVGLEGCDDYVTGGNGDKCVNNDARGRAKAVLGYWN